MYSWAWDCSTVAEDEEALKNEGVTILPSSTNKAKQVRCSKYTVWLEYFLPLQHCMFYSSSSMSIKRNYVLTKISSNSFNFLLIFVNLDLYFLSFELLKCWQMVHRPVPVAAPCWTQGGNLCALCKVWILANISYHYEAVYIIISCKLTCGNQMSRQNYISTWM